jgi:small-conductance mechanosensitive channel
LKFFPILIIYTFFTELLGYFIKYNDEFQFFSDARYSWHNVVIFNIYQLVFFLFFFEVYRKLFDQQMKKWIRYLSITCIVAYVINAMASNPLHSQMTYAHIIGSLMLVFVLFKYFRDKLKEDHPSSLRFNLMFWISIGLLIFYIVFPMISIGYKMKLGLHVQAYFRPALLTSIFLMYGFIIAGLLIGKRKAFR